MKLTFKNAELFRKWAYFNNFTKETIENAANIIRSKGLTDININPVKPNKFVIQSPIPNNIYK